ncbi:MAG TPA: hypothetical protein VF992_00455 [Thermoplasmata archaeon]
MGSIYRAFVRSLKVFGGAVLVDSIVAAVTTIFWRVTFVEVLVLVFRLSGIALLALALLVGSGFGELRLIGNPAYLMSSTYRGVVVDDRMQRRREEFWFMIQLFLLGIGLLLMTALT